MADYIPRLVDPLIGRLFEELPAVLVVGPRAAGKTTTAARYARTVVRLDRPAEAVAFGADPDAALRGLPEPVLLDEWQVVPAVLGAVKRAVDVDPRPGRYLLTGSVRADLDTETWPGTGRVVRIAMYGMTVRERLGRHDLPPLLDRVVDGVPLSSPPDPPDLRGYIELALQSGFPEATGGPSRLSEEARRRWLESYLDQLLTRDAEGIEGGRDPVRLRRYFEAYALNSAGTVEDKTLFDAAGINRKTAVAYEQLLRNLFVVDAVPAWTSNRVKRLVLTPKRYIVDPGLMGAALGLDVNAVLRDGNLLGRLLDTFVASELRSEATISEHRPRLYHLRQEQGRHEVDILTELGAGRVVAVEVKAEAGPSGSAAKHLTWLRDALGDRFTAGIVFHTGGRAYGLGDRIHALPICTLWN